MSTVASSDKESPPPFRPGGSDWVRIGWRVGAIMGWTSLVAVLLWLAWLPTLLAGPKGTQWRAQMRRRAQICWASTTLRILGVRVTTQGAPPPAGVLIVANHLSYLDIVVLAALLPVIFVSKAEVRRWPFWGLMATVAGTVYIDRARKRDALQALVSIDKALDRGDGVVIFPEATSTDGSTILEFKASLFASAAASKRPVHWLTIFYRTEEPGTSASSRVCWWGDMEFAKHFLGLAALKGIACTVRFGVEPVSRGERKVLAKTVREKMLSGFEPIA